MRVDILVFKGACGVSDDPYLRWGHIGVRFPHGPDIYGFGPAAGLAGSSGRLVSGEFSRHTQIFRKAVEKGLTVVSMRTRCVEPPILSSRLRHINTLKFALPTCAPNEISAGVATNCVGALGYLGVLLPASSLYIGEIFKLAIHRRDF